MKPSVQSWPRVAVVIPCYRVTRHIGEVLAAIGQGCHAIYVVDDACPDGSGQWVQQHCTDPRVHVLFQSANSGVGGAVMRGYSQALADGADIVVKIDGDGQHDPALIPELIVPLLDGEADYTKGNRFFDLDGLQGMPRLRIFGNAVLSFFNKLSTGYWNVFDPTNGLTAVRAEVLAKLPFDKISQRYFFESDMLFRLSLVRAVVVDVPMAAHYADEVSHLRVGRVVGEFLFKHLRNFGKRIFYNYFLRDVSLASLELLLGVALLGFGSVFGAWHWYQGVLSGQATPAGTVMLAALPVLMGLQCLLAFFGYDIANVPKRPRARPLRDFR
ncbi:glycosyltransferase family 2 protein [Macromonas nakdongensis]|uniref:glycosyltransferase family 2 protein n=1 Tax=Macromonas nakdongensis TaxID=1843082 RepID=UPI000C32F6E9|nr:glycosyltransferase family 2 protein [Macromonas nakdongensis]